MINPPDPPLLRDGVILRPFRRDDVAPLRLAINDPASSQWLNQFPDEETSQLFTSIQADRESDRELALTIAEADDDHFLGAVALKLESQAIGEISYVVAPQERGRGYARTAVRLLSEWAFTELRLGRLQVRVEPSNFASVHVAKAAGFRLEGILRSAVVVRGRRVDVAMFSRLPDEPIAGLRQPMINP